MPCRLQNWCRKGIANANLHTRRDVDSHRPRRCCRLDSSSRIRGVFAMTSEALGAHFIRTGVLSLAVTCALASMQAQAVGLGTIEVKSKLDQPFVAEIPLTLNNSDEANNLVVRMASPEAFERVGMDPNELSANLQFSIGRNARGE